MEKATPTGTSTAHGSTKRHPRPSPLGRKRNLPRPLLVAGVGGRKGKGVEGARVPPSRLQGGGGSSGGNKRTSSRRRAEAAVASDKERGRRRRRVEGEGRRGRRRKGGGGGRVVDEGKEEKADERKTV